jgi:hypothetical protein
MLRGIGIVTKLACAVVVNIPQLRIEPMSKSLLCTGPFLVAIAALTSAGDARAQVAVTVSPTFPRDITGGAPAASLQQSAAFAWQEFIALNWPALAGQRDVPDTGQKFGNQTGPLVWQTFRSKVEIFNTTAQGYPPGYSASESNYGYNAPVTYLYSLNPIAPCPGQTAPTTPAWINLDETTQISLDQMFNGITPISGPINNTAPGLIRFAVKANAVEYAYVVQNNYWYESPELAMARQNGRAAFTHKPPAHPAAPYVSFPIGTVEIKSAWRPLTSDDDPTHFHVATVRFYENKGEQGAACYFEEPWALVALHIIQKTPSAPSFIFATFEQAENIKTAGGESVEDANGTVINPPPAGTAPTTPALTYTDSVSSPSVTKNGPFCSPAKQLYFKDNAADSGLTGGGPICVNQRYEPFPAEVIAVNQIAHQAIEAYDASNNVQNSPWPYYKLVEVQAQPFDVADISPTNPNYSASVFYQANSVVETNYTLQQFKGRIASNNGAPTSIPEANVPPPNVIPLIPILAPPLQSPAVAGVNMGGCMGCHGNAQVKAGTDFSFILAEGKTPAPDTPSALELATTSQRYLNLFAPR